MLLLVAGCPAGRPAAEDAGPDEETDADGPDGAEVEGTDAAPDLNLDDGGADRRDGWPEAWDAAADVSEACEYREMTASCDGWEYAQPDLPHVDCGPGARELFLPQGVGSSTIGNLDTVTAWGDHVFVIGARLVAAFDLATTESRTIQCDYYPMFRGGYVYYWDGIGAVTAARFGAAAVLFRDVVDNLRSWDECPRRLEDIVYDWSTGDTQAIHTDYDTLPDDEGWPCSAGRLLLGVDAWGEMVAKAEMGPDCHIWITTLDLRTGELIPRVDVFLPPAWVSIWRDKIAFSVGDVEVVDLTTGDIRNLTGHPAQQIEPEIWEDRVVWTDWRNGNPDIYWHDLTTGETQPAGVAAGSQERPRIYGDVIVYDSNTIDEGRHVWMYDIATGENRQVTTLPGDQFVEELWEDKLFFGQLDPGVTRPTLCEMTIVR